MRSLPAYISIIIVTGCGPLVEQGPYTGAGKGDGEATISLTARRPIQLYGQGGGAWASDPLFGKSSCRVMSAAGCAITALAIVHSYYADSSRADRPRDPGALNRCLGSNGGSSGCLLNWGGCPEAGMQYLGSGGGSLSTLKGEIDAGHPVIAEVPGLSSKSGSHFVVVIGYDAPGTSREHFAIYDPAAGQSRRLSAHTAVRGTRRFRGPTSPAIAQPTQPTQPTQPSPADTVAPSVRITSPVQGQRLTGNGQVEVVIDATDNVGVTQVDLLVNGQPMGTASIAPYRFTVQLPQGFSELTAVAHDGAGLTSSSTIHVELTNQTTPPVPGGALPVVRILSPQPGAVLGQGQLTVVAEATDDGAVSRVDLLVDGALVQTRNALPYELVASLAAGQRVLTVVATDNQGNTGRAEVTVTVAAGAPTGPTGPAPGSDLQPPLVRITSPANGSAIQPQATVTVDATDDQGVAAVVLKANDQVIGTLQQGPYRFDVTLPAGVVNLVVEASDHAGNISTASVQVSVTGGQPQAIDPTLPSARPTTTATPGAQASTVGGCSLTNESPATPPAGLLLLALALLLRRRR